MKEIKLLSKIRGQKLTEGKKLSFTVVWVTSDYSVTKVVDERNHKKIEREVADEMKRNAGTDDFWVDQVWTDSIRTRDVDWMQLLTGSNKYGSLDHDMLESIFRNGEEFVIKMQFLNDQGYDINEKNLEEVQIWGRERNMIDTSFGSTVPEDWAWEQLENFAPDLEKALSRHNIEGYFDIGKWVGDMAPNGTAIWSSINGYFVYSYNV